MKSVHHTEKATASEDSLADKAENWILVFIFAALAAVFILLGLVSYNPVMILFAGGPIALIFVVLLKNDKGKSKASSSPHSTVNSKPWTAGNNPSHSIHYQNLSGNHWNRPSS